MAPEWELTEFESIEKAILIARRLGLYVQPVSPHPQGLVAFTVRGPDCDYTIAQALEGGPVKQKTIVRERKQRQAVPVPPLEDRIIGYHSFFVGDWKWRPTGDLATGAILVAGEYRAFHITGSAELLESLKVGDQYYTRIIAPPAEYRRDEERIDRIHEEWLAKFKESKGGGV